MDNKIIEWAISALVGAFIALVFEPVRRFVYGPKVRVTFTSLEDMAYFSITPDVGGNLSSWIRVRVKNHWGAAARGCRGYLAKVEEWDEGSREFVQAGYWDTQLLAWSSREKLSFDPVDIPRGIHQFLDVVAHPSQGPVPMFDVRTQFKPLREIALGKQPGLFILTVVVTGDNFSPKTLRLRYRWTGRWQSPEALTVRPRWLRWLPASTPTA